MSSIGIGLGNILPTKVAPGAVLPQSLSLSFTESYVFPILGPNNYHDVSQQRSVIQDGVNLPVPLRSWRLTKRLYGRIPSGSISPFSQFDLLKNFFITTAQGGLWPFYFYDPFGNLPGTPVGSNFDPFGVSSQGQCTVKFRGNWSQSITIGGLVNVGELEMIQIA